MASPLVGYNTNVRHHGKVYHIQTEDSGLAHKHIFTHLFADGGRIVATKKTTYSQHVGTDRYPGVVKKLMQAQHKAMFIALRDGLFDGDEVQGAKEFAAREITLDDERGDAQPTGSSSGALPAPTASSPGATPAVASARPDLDEAALERAAASYGEPIPGDMLTDRGPTLPGTLAAPLPPAAAIAPAAAAAPEAAKLPVARTFAKPAPAPIAQAGPVPAPPPAAKSKYATTQSAVKRPSTRPRESLFGQDLLSEKSLDEVIMSYLADDLDTKD
jgi:hypothetical protein